MGENSKIEWTDHTFNPWIGCQKVSPGCTNCYAEQNFVLRLGMATWGQNSPRLVTSPGNWMKPRGWNHRAGRDGKRPKVFCASLCDVFEDFKGAVTNHDKRRLWVADCEPARWVPERPELELLEIERQNIADGLFRPLALDDVRSRLWRLIEETQNLIWLLLTKRPENIARMLPAYMPNYIAEAGLMNQEEIRENLWLGTTVEDQAAADERIPELLKIPAAVRFLSCEPLLGPIVFPACFLAWGPQSRKLSDTIGWVIVGCESGPNRRPCSLDWVRSLRDQCQAAAVPVFIKQLDIGGQVVKELDQFPEDLRIREVPR